MVYEISQCKINNKNIHLHHWHHQNLTIGSIILIHGLGEHAGRYHDFASFFTNLNYAVYAPDLWGHGLTEGKRGHIESMDHFIDIIHHIYLQLPTELPVFIYGHSMGGCIVLYDLIFNQRKVHGVIATAPALATAFRIPKWKNMMGAIGKILFPSLTLRNGLHVAALSRDENIVANYINDPLTHDYVSAELGMGIIDWGSKLLALKSAQISAPCLIMHGTDDKITSFNASEKFSKTIQNDVTFIPWQDAFHELHNEPIQHQVLNSVYEWMNKYTPSK